MFDASSRGSIGDEDLKRRVLENLDTLDWTGKLEVLDFSGALAARRRASKDRGGALLAFAGSIPKEDLAEMRETIEEGCERVDEEGW